MSWECRSGLAREGPQPAPSLECADVALAQTLRTLEPRALSSFLSAVEEGESEALRRLLDRERGLATVLDAPFFAFAKPAVVHAASRGDRATLSVLLDFGADIDRLSSWEVGGFGVLHSTCFDHPELAAWLVDRGATIDVHSAAGLGDVERLRAMLDAKPEDIRRRGPDGQLPLHFAANVEILDFLLERGADLDARCVDHHSTAAQWAVQRAPELSRHLLDRGAAGDIFLAVALDDEALVEHLVESDPACLRARLGRPGYPPVAPGNIMSWNLGWWASGGRASPHRIAKARGNESLYERLLSLSPADVQLMVLAWQGEEERALKVVQRHPGLVTGLDPEDRRFMADVAWDGNAEAVRILLRAGFDPRLPGDHGSTPLDRAAFHGFADVIGLLLEHDAQPPLEVPNEFGGPPLETLVYGCRHGWRDDGDYPQAALLLAEAGAAVNPHMLEQAPGEVRRALLPFVTEQPGRSRRHRDDEPPVDEAAMGALEIIFDPNPTDVDVHERHGPEERPAEWVWYYHSEIHNRSARDLRLVWMEAFFFEDDRWLPGNGRGRALGSRDIVELFSEGDATPDGVLPAGASMTRPVAWLTGEGPIRAPVKWAVVAVDAEGVEHWAEAEIRMVPQLGI